MIPFKKPKIYVPFLAGLIILSILIIIIDSKKEKEDRVDYTLLTTKLGYCGVVKLIKPYKSYCYIDMNDNSKFLLNSARNMEYFPSNLNEFLTKGDSIVKPQDSDTLYIYRNEEQYYFVLGKIINKK